MKPSRSSIILIVFLIPMLSFAYDWDIIGPSDVLVNNYYSSFAGDILCTPDGIIINEAGGWNEYSYGNLPVWSVMDHESGKLLVIMGDGSYSDGIYFFDLDTHQFEIAEFFPNPNFLIYCHTNNRYYVGAQFYGLLSSEDGINWTPVDYFSGKSCTAMAYYQNHLVITEASNLFNVYYSDDYGETWGQAEAGVPGITDLSFDNNGVLYGIFPDHSNSSGLWSSTDYGETWSVEFWSDSMSSVHIVGGTIFVGWEESLGEMEGVATWMPDIEELTFMNEGLPNTNINKLSENTLIDCYNIVACTDSGAYLTCNFPSSINQFQTFIPPLDFKLLNYPNPFNPTTTIQLEVPINTKLTLRIYDISGTLIQTLVDEPLEAGYHSVIWDGKDVNHREVASGVYFYRVKTDGFEKTKRMILLR